MEEGPELVLRVAKPRAERLPVKPAAGFMVNSKKALVAALKGPERAAAAALLEPEAGVEVPSRAKE